MEKEDIIEKLIQNNIFKLEDGRELWQGSLPELQQLLGGTEVNIDTSKNAVYIVKNGKVIEVEAPSTGYGEQTVIWKDEKIIKYDVRTSKNL